MFKHTAETPATDVDYYYNYAYSSYGDYCCIKADGAAFVGRLYVTEAEPDDLGYVGEFEFGKDGKMILD